MAVARWYSRGSCWPAYWCRTPSGAGVDGVSPGEAADRGLRPCHWLGPAVGRVGAGGLAVRTHRRRGSPLVCRAMRSSSSSISRTPQPFDLPASLKGSVPPARLARSACPRGNVSLCDTREWLYVMKYPYITYVEMRDAVNSAIIYLLNRKLTISS